uniref:NADH-ubiquinone oxidoreductase chain 4 n=1 Tax=Leptobrachella alpina TaxID=1933071 RepID=A0A8F2WCM7_9ANUR|nr:NADH dehydrogenase subunit 4 [Leptobrachella alpina]
MLKILIPSMFLIMSPWLLPPSWLWASTTLSATMIAVLSLTLLQNPSESYSYINDLILVDELSAPFLILTTWLLPLALLASQKHLTQEPMARQRSYASMLIFLQFSLILAFSATEMILFFIMFETTLIPTLFIITRWGAQAERLNAGQYFLFYTLATSMPLLVALLLLHTQSGSLSTPSVHLVQNLPELSWTPKLLWVASLMAFLVKMPLYGVHLWLPKAHVEAPIAGSMILAAILLKLGGYGIMRVYFYLDPTLKTFTLPLIVLSLWGVVMTSSICLRQTDLKSMIAYSSVAHMGLVIASIMIQTPWSFTGAMILMIAHGVTSSGLFCLANLNYERTHSRTLVFARGLQTLLPLMASWWLILSLMNMALPPTTNLMGEIMIMISLFNWSPWTIVMTGFGALLTACYTLYMFLSTQRGIIPNYLVTITPTHTREHLLLSLHVLPMIFIIMKPQLIWGLFL